MECWKLTKAKTKVILKKSSQIEYLLKLSMEGGNTVFNEDQHKIQNVEVNGVENSNDNTSIENEKNQGKYNNTLIIFVFF